MALETTLAETNKLLTALLARLEAPASDTPPAQRVEKAKKPTAAPSAEAPATVTAAATPTVTEAAPTASPETASESPSDVTYEDVSKAIFAKVKEDRDAVVAALSKFGVKKGTELKADQYAAFLKEIA